MEILVDVWEGSLEVDETIFHDNGIAGMIIRLNDISGGHHIDANFANQWAQSESFLRAVYFVYNPWKTGVENYDWLMSHAPENPILFDDVEVKKAGYSPEIYADQAQDFHNRVKAHTKPVTYTGGWFLPILSHWNRDEYWWGRYPYKLCPQGDKVYWTWTEFRQKADAFGYHPDPTGICPGKPMLWQCSGDKVILPGTANRPIDLNLWSGTLSELYTWWGVSAPPVMSRLDILEREAKKAGWNLTP